MSAPRALVIDDSPTSRLLACNFLQGDGWEVREAGDAHQGTALARQWRPDVIVLDVVLPDADGVELCRRWRQEPELQEIPVLLISGERLEDEDRAAGLRSGALGYLVKPFSAVEFLASVRLLDQLGRTHGQLKARNAELEGSNRQLRQFAYVVSHDLKEPLRTVAGHCRRLAVHCRDTLDAQARRHLETAIEGTERMQRLIDDLLAYSHLAAAPVSRQRVDLAEVVRQAVDACREAVQQAQAAVRIGSLPAVLGSPALLGQVFQNLVSNALKFRGARAPVIDISATTEGDRCRVAVVDNGMGIAPEHCERIFELFERLHAAGEYPGSGIGLAVCRRVVERHGGRIWVESQPGQGSRFYVELPLALAGGSGEQTTGRPDR